MVYWNRSVGLALVIGWLVMTIIFGWLTFSTALDKETQAWQWMFLILVSVGSLVAAIVLVDGVVSRGSRFRSLLRPRPIASLYLASFTAFGVAVTLLGQFAPKPAVESAPRAIENKLVAADKKLDRIERSIRKPAPGERPRILTKIEGFWGERDPNCAVTYRFEVVEDSGLRISSDKRPAGTAAWSVGATIRPFGDSGDIMYTDADGKAATFIYRTNGILEHLRWDSSTSPALDLVRCGGSA